MTKVCNVCFKRKELEDFSIRFDCRLGVDSRCRMCRNLKERIQHQKDGYKRHSKSCKRYEKTPTGYLMRMYRNMLSRVRGVQKVKAHLYKGKEILPKKQFYSFALQQSSFISLWSKYKQSRWDLKLAPSINRIDSSRGYTLDNMEFITQSENSRLGALSLHYKEKV